MPSAHQVRAWVAVTREEWLAFRARGTVAGLNAGELLARLVRHELAAAGEQLELTYTRAQPPVADPAAAASIAASSISTKRAEKAPRRSRKPAAATPPRKKASAKAKQERSSTKALSAARTNKRSPSAKQGRPTRRRS